MDNPLIACQDCDLLHEQVALPNGAAAECTRCGSTLYRERHNTIEKTLALTIAGLFLFAVANMLPFLTFDMKGRITETTLTTGVVELWNGGMELMAVLVLITAVVAPAIELLLLLYVLLPLWLGRVPPNLNLAFRVIRHVQPWSMMEVFLIAILVALVKLVEMAEIIPGLALWAFGALILVLAGTASTLDPRAVWAHVDTTR